jgi:hypothetical protein
MYIPGSVVAFGTGPRHVTKSLSSVLRLLKTPLPILTQISRLEDRRKKDEHLSKGLCPASDSGDGSRWAERVQSGQ